MKNKHFLVASIMMLMPMTIHAQGYIKRAFNMLITSEPAKVESTHKLNKDPETGIKEGQLDVYEFTIPVSHHDLVDGIKQAFDQDKEKAYSMSSTFTKNKKMYNYTSLAVGGDNNGYPLGEIKDSRYIYALFLDPEDKSKTHRYAYAMEWCEGTKEIVGKLIVTYATTQQYRTRMRRPRIIKINGNTVMLDGKDLSFGDGFTFGNDFPFSNDSVASNRKISSDNWLSEFNTFKNLYTKNPEGTAANYYASFIYKLCKNAGSLDDAEKAMVAKELEKLKKITKDDFIKQLFHMSAERLMK